MLDIFGEFCMLGWGIILFFIFVILFTFFSGIRIVRPLEKGVVERFGRFKRVTDQGFKWIIPVVDKMYKINLTERMIDVLPQEVITEDNLNAKVDLVVYYKVMRDDESVKKSIYNVDRFETQIVSLAQTTARNVIGTMNFKSVNSERNKINFELAKTLDKESDAWGVQIVRVEMKEITPPPDVQETMNKVLKAENEKVAARDFATAKETEADGIRRSDIKIAEGRKQAAILESEGKAEAIIKVAEADAAMIQKVNTAIQQYFKNEAQMYKKLETVENSLRNGTKYVIDPNTEITNVIAERMAGIVPIEKKTKKE
ncbi:MAG: SPFH/Band 7/PHB domain protein [Thermoplasmatales archaeon]|nr:SPFH/Band 7/PHB domain protein [Thermoplasmatales archaeon]